MVCEAHNTLWCGCNERECEIPERERGRIYYSFRIGHTTKIMG